MYCENCGIELSHTALFCSACGHAVKAASIGENRESKKPLLEIVPVFEPRLVLFDSLPITLFATVWVGMFFGVLGGIAIEKLELTIPFWLPGIIMALCSLAMTPWFIYTMQKKSYAKTHYIFYTDRLEFAEGFLTVEKKTVKYAHIHEANLRKGFFQKHFSLGTIILSTAATTGHKNGIYIADIENAEEIYAKVLEFIR